MVNQPPACMFYWADFRMSTDTFSVAQVGVYHRLLTSEWINGPLPTQMSRLAKIVGVDVRNMKKMWDAGVGKKLVGQILKDDKLIVETLDYAREFGHKPELDKKLRKQKESIKSGLTFLFDNLPDSE